MGHHILGSNLTCSGHDATVRPWCCAWWRNLFVRSPRVCSQRSSRGILQAVSSRVWSTSAVRMFDHDDSSSWSLNTFKHLFLKSFWSLDPPLLWPASWLMMTVMVLMMCLAWPRDGIPSSPLELHYALGAPCWKVTTLTSRAVWPTSLSCCQFLSGWQAGLARSCRKLTKFGLKFGSSMSKTRLMRMHVKLARMGGCYASTWGSSKWRYGGVRYLSTLGSNPYRWYVLSKLWPSWFMMQLFVSKDPDFQQMVLILQPALQESNSWCFCVHIL